jgi:hypothetical protein
MISSDNQPNRATTSDEDFTEAHYRQLLRAAKASYGFADYVEIPWGTRFVLWRHDLDYSINRALRLAQIEAEESVAATYFVNPHSDFYNPFELRQAQCLKHILSLGHSIGLHFDATFHNIQDEAQLHCKVEQEGRWLQETFGVRPVAFSFHNPVAAHLQCDADSYGGLINCYSQRFKSEINYCSDSNGYWRFRRLHDVLSEGTDPCLQVLTHPGWWQVNPMPPRQRIFRSVFGRAASTMRLYDQGLEEHGRLNHAGPANALRVLKASQPQQYGLCDVLWNQGAFPTLFIELWRHHEAQINRLIKTKLRKEWSIPAREVNEFFEDRCASIDAVRIFEILFQTSWQEATGLTIDIHGSWVKLRDQLVHSRASSSPARVEEGCIYLCEVLKKLAIWGMAKPFEYDGLAPLSSIGLPTVTASEEMLVEKVEESLDLLSEETLDSWYAFLDAI